MADKKYPEPTVGALIFNPEGKIFLMKSNKWHDNFVIPGGHIELGETVEQALKREIKEETGLDIFDLDFLGWQEAIFSPAFWKKKHFVFLDFVCQTNSSGVKLNEEAQEYVWVDPEEALSLPVEPFTKITVETYLKKFSS